MKKNLIALLIVALVSVGLFAADPATANDSFTVTTSISGINNMKVTTTAVGTDGKTYSQLADFSNYAINSASDLSPSAPIAYLSTQTNNRNGYKISLTVTAMKSPGATTATDSYINYTIFLGTDTTGLATGNGTEKTKSDVIQQGALGGLTEKSYPIKIAVKDADEYAAAVEGSYTGTVTFNYTAL